MSKHPRKRFEGPRKTAKLYLKSKIGVAGLVIILFFILLAVFAPDLTTNDPIFSTNVSSPYSVPIWATVFPRYQGFAPTLYVASDSFRTQSDALQWTLTGPSIKASVAPSIGPPGSPKNEGALLINASLGQAQQNSSSTYLPGGQVVFTMSRTFQFNYKPPSTFTLFAYVDPASMRNISAVYANFVLSSPSKNFSLGTILNYNIRNSIMILPNQAGSWKNVTLSSGLLPLSGLSPFASTSQPGSIIFSQAGKYDVAFQLLVVPSGANPQLGVYVTGVGLHIFGKAYGLLGTDNQGHDLWSQFVWGSRVSLLIGILSGVGAVAVGTALGLSAGYLGGWVDDVISRATDFFLVIPFLPLAIIAILLIGQSPVLYQGIYYWIIALFVALSWPTVTRIIRSQVLSVKERSYVEASRAVGGGSGHIIRRHILPNVMGLVYSQAALNVAGFILLEAALDFLAVSIHPINTITWGITLTNSLGDALSNSTVDYAWWWFLPPGIAIAALSLAFVLVGFALDSIFNPRLRAR